MIERDNFLSFVSSFNPRVNNPKVEFKKISEMTHIL